MSDAKPRTSLRSYWHTLPKKKEQTPLKTRVRYNKAISVHRPSHGAVRGRYRSYSYQPASSQPPSKMEVWMTRHQIEVLDFFSAITGAELSQKHTGPPPLSTQRALDIYEDSLAPSPVYITAYDNSIRPARGRLIADVQIGLKTNAMLHNISLYFEHLLTPIALF